MSETPWPARHGGHVRLMRPPNMQCTHTNREGDRCPNEAIQTGNLIACEDHAAWFVARQAEAVTDPTFDGDTPV